MTAATNRECDKRSYANKLLSIASAVFLALAVLQGTGAAWAQEGEEASETVNAADAASQENSASIDPSSSIDATETAGGDAADAVRSGFEPMATVYVSNRDQLATAISTAADGDIIYVQSNIDMGGSGLGVGGSRSLTIASDMAAPGAPFTITVDRGRHFIIGNGADIAINDLTLEGAGLSGWPTGPLSAPSGGFDVIDASLALTNVTVRNCFNDPSGAPAYNSWGHGGAIFVTSSVSTASLTVVSSRFLGNSAFMQAGAIFAEGDAVLDIGGTTEFTDNTTLTENGGAISVGDNVQVSLSDSVSFLGNDGCAGGGGINIYGNASLTTIGDLLFEDNEAGRGGGINISTSGSVDLGGNIEFLNNSATYLFPLQAGGAIYLTPALSGSLTISGNVTFSGNTASGDPVLHWVYPNGFTAAQITGSVASVSPTFAYPADYPQALRTDLGLQAFNGRDIGPCAVYDVEYRPGEHGSFAAVTATYALGSPTPAYSGTPAAQPGWEFEGWAPAVELTVTQDRVYTAQWRAIDYALSFDANGADSGSVPAGGAAHHVGDVVALPGNTGGLARSGHSFAGWSLTPGGQAVEAATFGAGDMTVYAVWAPLTSAAAGTTPATGEAPGAAAPTAAALAAAGAASLAAAAALRRRRKQPAAGR